MSGRYRLKLGLCLCTLLTGCGAILQSPTPTTVVQQDIQSQEGRSYRLGPGDQIEIHHLIDTDYSALTTIRPDGRVSVPGITNPVMAAGKTIEEVADQIGPLYHSEARIRSPSFTILLRNSASQQVFVGGEVTRPGFLELEGGPRHLVQVITAAGWFLPTARMSEVIIVRQAQNGQPIIFSANMRKVISGEDLGQNYLIRPQDTVLVPKSDIASFDSWIERYVHQPVPGWASAAVTYQFGSAGGSNLVH